MTLWGGIEAGGTKFVCVVGSGPDDIRQFIKIPTTTPEETLPQVIAFFQQQEQLFGPMQGLGIGSFGPIDPNPKSPTFGYVTSTPKLSWTQTDLVGQMQAHFAVPIGFDTDVNTAALGEYTWGAAQGLDTFIYLTVGTGIGGGGMIDGQLMHGLNHPEMGHLFIPMQTHLEPVADFKGSCPFHGTCWEGLASGTAIVKRWKQDLGQLPKDNPAWALEARYLALGLVNLICTLSPQRIILGGGVMHPQLFPLIHQNVQDLLQGYLQVPEILDDIENYIVPTGLGNRSGMLGAIALAQRQINT